MLHSRLHSVGRFGSQITGTPVRSVRYRSNYNVNVCVAILFRACLCACIKPVTSRQSFICFYLDMHINIISELRNMPVSYCFSKCMLYLHKGMDNGRIMEGIWRSVKAVRQMLGRSMNTVTLNGGPLEQLSTSIIEDSGKPVSLVGLDDT